MSSPAMNACAHSASSHYLTPPTEAIDRHESGVQKNRKPASTGGGRAWSEDEEVYLLQTRLQKMPYKHIAAHLKKTELACRLHYHQLSHGSNRRKRTTSVSSDSSIHSTDIHASSIPSPIQEMLPHSGSNPSSPTSFPYSPETRPVRLPSAASLIPYSDPSPPQWPTAHPIAILPKPSGHRPCASNTPPLRLDCDVAQTTHTLPHSIPNANSSIAIDHARLAHIYNSHRTAFWSAVAVEYGHGATSQQLEDAWRHSSHSPLFAAAAPPTPCVSPDGDCTASSEESAYQRGTEEKAKSEREKEGRSNATSISALLGIDASPRSPKERELIKQLEEQKSSLGEIRMEGI